MNPKTKVLVIGLDGTSWNLITPWLENGKLPTLDRLIKNGVSGDLESVIPPLTPPAWTSFITGKNPGKHGIFSFLKSAANSYEFDLVTSLDIKTKGLWDYLGEKDKKSIILNLPNTHPVLEINGIMVSGYPTHSTEKCCYPEHIIEELEESIGEYIVFPEHKPIEKLIPEIHHIIEKRKDAAIYLMNKYDNDFFFVQFQMSDLICHETNDANKILDVYKKIDDAIDEILQNIDPNTNIILISDHGIGPLKKTISINKWLHNLGLYNAKIGSQKENPGHVTKISHEKEKNKLEVQNKKRTGKIVLFELLSSLGITAERIRYLLSRFHLNFIKKLFRGRIMLPHTITDWSRTKAYNFYHICGIRINLEGREPQGIVKPSEYEELRNFIIKELYNLTEPETDEKIIKRVFKREEIYSGTHIDNAPDILFTTKNDEYDVNSDFNRKEIVSKDSGYITHKMNGIFIAYGPDVKQLEELRGAKIIDIAPTILHMFGLPVPEDMDGRVLKEIFKEDSEPAERDVIYQKVGEKERIRERIMMLKKTSTKHSVRWGRNP